MLLKSLYSSRSDIFTKTDVKNIKFIAITKLLKTCVCDRVLKMIGSKFFLGELILQESDDGELLKVTTERDIDSD